MATPFLEKIQIPEGFEEVLHDVLKEILREQPENINNFCLEYFQSIKNGNSQKGSFNKNKFGLLREEETKKQEFENSKENINNIETSSKLDQNKTNKEKSEPVLDTEEVNAQVKNINNNIESEENKEIEKINIEKELNSDKQVKEDTIDNSTSQAELSNNIKDSDKNNNKQQIGTSQSITEAGSEYLSNLIDSIAKEN